MLVGVGRSGHKALSAVTRLEITRAFVARILYSAGFGIARIFSGTVPTAGSISYDCKDFVNAFLSAASQQRHPCTVPSQNPT